MSAPVRKSISFAGLAVSSRRCFWRPDTHQPWLWTTTRSLARSGSRLTTLVRPRDYPPAPSTGTGRRRKVSPAFVAMLVCLGGHLSDRPGHLDRSSQVKLAGRKPRTVSSTRTLSLSLPPPLPCSPQGTPPPTVIYIYIYMKPSQKKRLALTTRTRKGENSKEFRNFYRVLDRVPAHGAAGSSVEPAEMMLFLTGADSARTYLDK